MQFERAWGVMLLAGSLLLAGCTVSRQDASENTTSESGGELSGTILIDGSSTVYPVSQAVAEEFMTQHTGVQISVGTSGTGGGFKKFVIGEIIINDASRPIKEEEIARAKENGIEFLELKVAVDGLSVIVNPKNDWVDCLSVEQLRKLWEPESKVSRWSDLNPRWPAEEIKLYGADTESGTFDYFTEAINGKEGASRSDYTPSANDNVLVTGVSGDLYSLGYFGYAYFAENQEKLKRLSVSATEGGTCVFPTPETIESGEYSPLSRPLYLYVNKAALKRPEVAAFLRYFLNEGQEFVGEVGFIRVGKTTLEQARQELEEAIKSVNSGKS